MNNEKFPKEFVFEGRIIMAFNALDKRDPNVKAIMSRCPTVELNFSHGEVVDAMWEVAKGG